MHARNNQLHRGGRREKSRCIVSARALLGGVFVVVLVLYAFALLIFHKQQQHASNINHSISRDYTRNKQKIAAPASIQNIAIFKDERSKKRRVPKRENKMTYKDWRNIAVDLAMLSPEETLKELETKDPFGTRTFERQLLESESLKGATLELDEVKKLFWCPSDRITLPDQRNHSKSEAFRKGADTFLFFQHLRKAGGTNFCSLAQTNLPTRSVPSYYCMPDIEWTRPDGRTIGAGYLHHWSNEEIATRIKNKGYRIAGNEWDSFRQDHFELPAAFVTSFRRPLDRALSQFRFECIEDRGCTIKDVGVWWKERMDLYNVYAWTFSDVSQHGIIPVYTSKSTEDAEKRGQVVGNALDTIAKFHLVLSMEWLAYAESQVRSVLGFQNTSSLTKRVRPHINQAERNDGQEVNKLGAAGIAKASWDPKEYLTPEQYKDMSEHMALDEILTDAARRIFLEHLVCNDLNP
jgi:hypothetical protein